MVDVNYLEVETMVARVEWVAKFAPARYSELLEKPALVLREFKCQQVRSQLQLKPRLEKLSSTGEVESIQRPIPIDHLEPDVVGKMPVDHWRNFPELPASQRWLSRSM